MCKIPWSNALKQFEFIYLSMSVIGISRSIDLFGLISKRPSLKQYYFHFSGILNPGFTGIFSQKPERKNPEIFWDFRDQDLFSSGFRKIPNYIRLKAETLQKDTGNPK